MHDPVVMSTSPHRDEAAQRVLHVEEAEERGDVGAWGRGAELGAPGARVQAVVCVGTRGVRVGGLRKGMR